jgi:hypothetical protein
MLAARALSITRSTVTVCSLLQHKIGIPITERSIECRFKRAGYPSAHRILVEGWRDAPPWKLIELDQEIESLRNNLDLDAKRANAQSVAKLNGERFLSKNAVKNSTEALTDLPDAGQNRAIMDPYETNCEPSEVTKKILFVPDAHHPFVDTKVWSLLLRVCRGWKPDRVVILGDFADCYAVSFFPKDPSRACSLDFELQKTKAALRELRAAADNAQMDYIFGNHEHRFERYIADKAPALCGMVSLEDALGFSEMKISKTQYKQSLQIGKLRITHDFGKHGAGAVLDAQDTVQGNAVIGHIHAMNVVYRGSVFGDVHVGASFGWLGDFGAVDYRHRDKAHREWSHGFGIGRLESNGNIHLQAVPVVAYRSIVEGVVFS